MKRHARSFQLHVFAVSLCGAFLTLAVLAACSSDLTVPQEAQLGCASSADCPSGWTCNEKVGRCVKTENIDSDAPALVGDVTVTPSVLKKGAKATVSFSVSEDLSKPPVVTINAGTDRVLTLDEKLSEAAVGSAGAPGAESDRATRYVFTYLAAGDEPQGVESPVSIVLTDESGNESGNLSGGSLKFDFISPSIPADKVLVTGSPAKKDGVVTVKFSVSEPLDADPVVSLALTPDPVPLVPDASSAGQDYVFAYTATGEEPEDAAGAAVTVALVDEAGNTSTEALGTTVVFDFTAPLIDGAVLVDPQVASSGTSVTMTFAASEDLLDDPVVTAGGVAVPGVRLSGRDFKYTYAVTSADTEGERPIVVALSDPAGNETTVTDAGSFVVDLTAPRVVSGTLALKDGRTRFSSVTGHDSIELSFDVDEEPAAMGASLQTAGGTVPVTCGTYSPQSPNYACSYTVDGTEGAGLHAIVVTLLDEAGNRSAESREVFFDFAAPQVVSIDVNPPLGRLGGTLVYSATADEPLGAGTSPLLSVSGIAAWSNPNVAGTLVTWMHTIGPGAAENGTHAAAVSGFCDEVGNCAAGEVQGKDVEIDNVMPGISSPAAVGIDTGYPRAKDGAVVTVGFTVSETLASAPEARLGSRPMTCGGTHPDYSCTRTVSAAAGEDAEGVTGVYLILTDTASNQTTLSAGSVQVDFTPPGLVGAEASPNRAKNGVTIAYSVTADEPLSAKPADAPVMAAARQGGAGTLAFSLHGGTSYVFEHEVTAADADGTYDASVSMTDLAGNTATRSGMAFEVDASIPQVSGFKVSPAGASAQPGHNVITVEFDSTEAATTDVKVGANQTAPCTATGNAPAIHYTCVYTVVGAPTDHEGQNVVSVAARDQFGNQGGESGGAILDFSPPSVAGSSATPSPAPRGGVVTYTLNTTEPMDASHPPVLSVSGVSQWGAAAVTQTTAFWTRTVTGGAGENGTHGSTVTNICDMLGNCAATYVGAQVNIDNADPTLDATSLLTSNPLNSALAKMGEKVTLVLSSNETLKAAPTVKIGGAEMAVSSQVNNEWTFERTTVADDTDGSKIVTVTATDVAGNVKVQDLGNVTYDFTEPSVGSASVRFVPAATCPLGSVGKVGVGATAKVSFTVNEPLRGDPAFSDMSGTWTVTKTAGSSPGLYYEYDLVLTGGSPSQGEVTPAITLEDRAGNVGAPVNLTSAKFEVDTVVPDAPDVGTTDRVVYRRIPWGSDATGGIKTFQIIGGANAVDTGTATVLAFDGPDPATAAEIGRKTAAGGTFGTIDLNRADRAEVHVAAYDGACNRSQVVKVRDAEWTATMGYKVPGSAFENPHRFETHKAFSGPLSPPHFVEQGAGDGLGLAGTPPFVSARGELTWKEWSIKNMDVSARSGHMMAYDSARGKVVLFGGSGTDDTWEWDGERWAFMNPAAKPSTRSQAAMAYDALRGKAVLFGGFDGAELDETWEWDGETWFRRDPPNRPSARMYHAMAYDSARGRVVLFGGNDGAAIGETWEWDGTDWMQRTPAVKPSARYGHAMAYDNARGVTVVFGGNTGGDETWEWDGTNWVKRTPVDKPSARYTHAMAYDDARGTIVLFGGADPASDDETWEWDGTNWVKRIPPDKPAARTGHAMAYDAARERVVLFGGSGGWTDTWEWDGTGWALVAPATAEPTDRYETALAYDSAREKVVLFGGYDGARDDETWEFGAGWRDVFVFPTKPSARESHAMAYDAARGKVILFGGSDAGGANDETWVWDLTTWTKLTPASKPSARQMHAMAYDSARGKVVLFGGNDGAADDETWEWDGANWTMRTPADRPAARYWHAMAYDSRRGVTVLFGGTTGGDETWEWDGTNWTIRTPVDKPSSRSQHTMAYDPARRAVVLFAGFDGTTDDETWEWDGTNWTKLDPVERPSARRFHSMTYHGARGKVMLFGGFSTAKLGDTWELDTGATSRPGQIMKAAFSAAGTDGAVTVRSASGTIHAGASGYAAGVATNGVDLKVWDEGMWKTVATNNSPPDNPQLVTWTTTDPAVIPRLFFGDQQTLNFAVTPTAPNGTGTGEVSVDYAEVTVKYRLP